MFCHLFRFEYATLALISLAPKSRIPPNLLRSSPRGKSGNRLWTPIFQPNIYPRPWHNRWVTTGSYWHDAYPEPWMFRVRWLIASFGGKISLSRHISERGPRCFRDAPNVDQQATNLFRKCQFFQIKRSFIFWTEKIRQPHSFQDCFQAFKSVRCIF